MFIFHEDGFNHLTVVQAEKILFDEFATVLDIKQEDVLPFIIGQLECGEKEGA